MDRLIWAAAGTLDSSRGGGGVLKRERTRKGEAKEGKKRSGVLALFTCKGSAETDREYKCPIIPTPLWLWGEGSGGGARHAGSKDPSVKQKEKETSFRTSPRRKPRS